MVGFKYSKTGMYITFYEITWDINLGGKQHVVRSKQHRQIERLGKEMVNSQTSLLFITQVWNMTTDCKRNVKIKY